MYLFMCKSYQVKFLHKIIFVQVLKITMFEAIGVRPPDSNVNKIHYSQFPLVKCETALISLQDLFDLGDLAETERRQQFHSHYDVDKANGVVKLKDIDVETTDERPNKFFLSFSLCDQAYVHLLTSLLRRSSPTLVISDQLADSTLELDSATHVIVFMSVHYRKSQKQMEEFIMIISKLRARAVRVYVVTLSAMPLKPTYLHLVPSYTSLVDAFWEDVLPLGQGREVLGDAMYARMLEQSTECQKLYHTDVALREVLALYKCACDVSVLLFGSADK